MHGAIVSARFQLPTVLLGECAICPIVCVLIQQPQNAGKEAFAPVRPAFAFAAPFAADGVHRYVAGMLGKDAVRLRGRKAEGILKPGQESLAFRFGRFDHGTGTHGS